MSQVIRATAGVISAAPSWVEHVVDTNSATAGLYKASGLTFATSTKIGIFACRLRAPDPWPSSGVIFEARTAGGSIRFQLTFTSSGRITFYVRDSTNTNCLQFTNQAGTLVHSTAYHMAFSWDCAATTFDSYLNGSSWSEGTGVKTIADLLPDTVGRIGIGCTAAGAGVVQIRLSNVVFDNALSTFIPLSTNIGSLYSGGNTVDPGDGTPIKGSSMPLIVEGNAAFWNNTSGNNRGTAGALGKTAGDFVDSTW